jgi:hypothetical protein
MLGPRRLVRFCLRGGLGDESVYGSVAPRSKKEKEVREGSVIMFIPDLREMTLTRDYLMASGLVLGLRIYKKRGGCLSEDWN